MLTLNIFFSYTIVDFEQVNISSVFSYFNSGLITEKVLQLITVFNYAYSLGRHQETFWLTVLKTLTFGVH